MITKDELLQEAKQTQTIQLECIGEEITIKKLSYKEITSIQAQNNDTKQDNEKDQSTPIADTIITTIQYSLNLPNGSDQWTTNEIESLPYELVQELYQHILKYNKLITDNVRTEQ